MARRRKRKRFGYVKCGICGRRIRYRRGYVTVNGVDAGRLIAIRRHWKRRHPRAWRQAIQRGVIKRAIRRARLRKR